MGTVFALLQLGSCYSKVEINMNKLPYKKRRNLRFAIQACLATSLAFPIYASAQAQDAQVDEIIVTGSFIRRDNFNQASPLTQISAQDIEETGTVNMGDVLFNLSAQSGTSTGDTTPFSATNLRGLGAGATMDLMDGHRLLFGDANNTYPQIAIDRVDILLDGASALYGSEAIAGVVNYIPKKRMDGVEMRFDARAIEGIGSSPDAKYGIVGGWGTDDGATNFVFAYEYRKRDEVRQTHTKFGDYIDSRVNRRSTNSAGLHSSSGPWSNMSNPGTFDRPKRNADGSITTKASGLTSTTTTADPACQFEYNDGGQNFRDQGSWMNGILTSSGKCEANAFNYRTYVSELEQHKAYAYMDHQFTDNFSIHAQFVMGEQNEADTNNTVGAVGSSRVSNSVSGNRFLVAGTHPGNPFRANVGGQPIYAQDLNQDGIPDRDGSTSSFNSKWGGNVNLANDMYDPSQGIPFYDDVYLDNQYSVIGSTRNPNGGYSRFADADGNTEAKQFTTTQRYQLGAEYLVGDTDWILNADYIYANRQRNRAGTFGNGDESLSAIERGLDCSLGELQNKCFNPFGTAFFLHDADNQPQPFFQTDPNLINDQEVYDRMLSPAEQQNNYLQNIVDVVFAGPLPLELQGGPLAMAFGGHIRIEEEEFRPDRLALLEDRTRGSSFKKRLTETSSFDTFVEVNAPVLDSTTWGTLELSAAYRETDNDIEAITPVESGSGNFREDIKKFGAIYQPPMADWISMRASYGEGYVMPAQFTAFGDKRIEQATTSQANGGDYSCEALVDEVGVEDRSLGTSITGVTEAMCSTAGGIDYRRTSVASPKLQGSMSESYNVGFSLSLLDGRLGIDVDRFEVEFMDQILYIDIETQGDILRNAFLTAGESNGCANGDAACWMGFRDTWVTTGGGESQLSNYQLQPGEQPSVDAPNSTLGYWRLDPGDPTRITDTVNSYRNLESNTSVTYDVRTRFSFDADEIPFIGGDYGSFVATLDATFVDKFTLTPDPTDPGQVNVAGQLGRSEGLQDGGSPRWKGSAALRWAMGNQTARLTGRYHHHVADLNIPSGTCTSTLSNASCRVDSMATFSLFYQYRFQDLLGMSGETTLSMTVDNLFNRLPDPQQTSVTPYSASLDRNNWGRYYNLRLQHTF